jgi:magnesium-transporting ATPase (P-type)
MIFIKTQRPIFCVSIFPYLANLKNKPMSAERTSPSIFNKENYMWMLIGAVVMAIGMFLMAGGKNTDPNIFDTSKVYSTTRITIAPLLILAGLVIEIYAIFKRPKKTVE